MRQPPKPPSRLPAGPVWSALAILAVALIAGILLCGRNAHAQGLPPPGTGGGAAVDTSALVLKVGDTMTGGLTAPSFTLGAGGALLPSGDGTGYLGSNTRSFAEMYVQQFARGNTFRLTLNANAHNTYRGATADGSAVYAHTFGNANALTGTAKIVSFFSDNFTTEKAYLDANGVLYVSGLALGLGTQYTASRLTFPTGTYMEPYADGAGQIGSPTRNFGSIYANGIYSASTKRLHFSDGGTNDNYYVAKVSNGATVVAHSFRNTVALTNAGAKILAFYRDNGTTQVAYVGALGDFVSLRAGASGAEVPALTINTDTRLCLDGPTCSRRIGYASNTGVTMIEGFLRVGGLEADNSVAATSSNGGTAFQIKTNGARMDFGAGTDDYASSDGTSVSFAGPIRQTPLAALPQCGTTVVEGAQVTMARSGAAATRPCVCIINGAGTSVWRNLLNPSVDGTATTCPATP